MMHMADYIDAAIYLLPVLLSAAFLLSFTVRAIR